MRNPKRLWSVVLVTVFAWSVRAEPAKTALVIIDMQPKFVTRGGNHETPGNVRKVEKIIATQKKVIREAIRARIPIVVVEYKNYDPTDERLKSELKGYDKVEWVVKTADGLFSSENKEKESAVRILEDNGIEKLIVVGANGGFCVKSSISGALKLKYDVVAVSNGIADFNYTDFLYPYEYKTAFDSVAKDATFVEVRSVDKLKEVLGWGVDLPHAVANGVSGGNSGPTNERQTHVPN